MYGYIYVSLNYKNVHGNKKLKIQDNGYLWWWRGEEKWQGGMINFNYICNVSFLKFFLKTYMKDAKGYLAGTPDPEVV